jgi:hypothetical protein
MGHHAAISDPSFPKPTIEISSVLFAPTIGIRHPVPKARDVTFSTGAACFRLNSAFRIAGVPGVPFPRHIPAHNLFAVAMMCSSRSGPALGGLIRPQLRRRSLGRVLSGMSAFAGLIARQYIILGIRDHRQSAFISPHRVQYPPPARFVPGGHSAPYLFDSAISSCPESATGCFPRSHPVIAPPPARWFRTSP